MKRFTRCAALLLIVTLLLGFVACGGKQETDVPEGMKNATVAGDDFRLYIPTSWTENTAYGVSGGYATLSAQSTVSATKHEISEEMEAEMQTALTSVEEDKMGEARIDWFWSCYCLPAIRALSSGSNFTEVEAKSLDLLDKYNAWRYHWQGAVDGTGLHFLQVIAEKDRAFYLISFTADETQYARQLANVELILDSFVFSIPYDPVVNEKTADAATPAGMKLASNDDVAYRFYVPEAWEINHTDEIFSAYLKSDRSSVSIVPYMPAAESMSVAEYFALCESMMKNTTTVDGYELISETKEVDLGGRMATAYVYRYTVGGKEYRYKQVIAAYKSMIYSLTYTSTPESFEAHLSDVDAMTDAFEFR